MKAWPLQWIKWIGCIVLALAVARLLLWPEFFPTTPPGHGRPRCSSNLKRLALATMMYSQDHDDRYPLALNWQEGIFPYIKYDDAFRCPMTPSTSSSRTA